MPTNSSFTFWLLDPSLGSFGGYYTYNGTDWTPIAPNQNADQPENLNIQSGQGFFVRSTSNTTFAITESDKVVGNSNTWFARSGSNVSEDTSTELSITNFLSNDFPCKSNISTLIVCLFYFLIFLFINPTLVYLISHKIVILLSMTIA